MGQRLGEASFSQGGRKGPSVGGREHKGPRGDGASAPLQEARGHQYTYSQSRESSAGPEEGPGQPSNPGSDRD